MGSEPQGSGNNGAQGVEMTQQSYPPPAPSVGPPAAPLIPQPATAPATASPVEPPVANAPLNKWGHNTRLASRDIKRAILEHVQKLAGQAGQQVPDDIVRFLEEADIVFLDKQNQPVSFDRVIVTWENM